ncbi:uncharacterized protein EMH_0017280 [Eimeria mitis]|uniref:Uncharacterized protein n=1 Tax=Eimeria mitis TaxID=44415 RepID=U6KE43_9EIME|nr:uncharacterized protein EMH_0017280 [Eimeria mitis]CDJ33748.1 hypothetical protein EMH_0017280 [Eimeria mitis]
MHATSNGGEDCIEAAQHTPPVSELLHAAACSLYTVWGPKGNSIKLQQQQLLLQLQQQRQQQLLQQQLLQQQQQQLLQQQQQQQLCLIARLKHNEQQQPAETPSTEYNKELHAQKPPHTATPNTPPTPRNSNPLEQAVLALMVYFPPTKIPEKKLIHLVCLLCRVEIACSLYTVWGPKGNSIKLQQQQLLQQPQHQQQLQQQLQQQQQLLQQQLQQQQQP